MRRREYWKMRSRAAAVLRASATMLMSPYDKMLRDVAPVARDALAAACYYAPCRLMPLRYDAAMLR